jgi:hypothetical protein
MLDLLSGKAEPHRKVRQGWSKIKRTLRVPKTRIRKYKKEKSPPPPTLDKAALVWKN